MLNRVTGIVIFAAGVVMLTLAYQEYNALGAKITRFINPTLSDKIIYLLSAGAVCSTIGIYQIMRWGR